MKQSDGLCRDHSGITAVHRTHVKVRKRLPSEVPSNLFFSTVAIPKILFGSGHSRRTNRNIPLYFLYLF